MLTIEETMGLNYYASSPVLVPPGPQRTHTYPNAAGDMPVDILMDPSSSSSVHQPIRKFIPKYPTPPSLNYLAKSSNNVAGRKRTRIDIDDDHSDDDGGEGPSSKPLAIPQPKAEPIMGSGMTLIYADEPSLNISPESQSGTWLEEQADQESATTPSRPRPIARKSQRLLGENDVPAPGDVYEIDPIVLKLGIGWKCLYMRTHSIAGLEAFIKKQFPLQNPQLQLHHEGLGIYVVRSEPPTAQGYWYQWWLFREDLKSCRFLCNDDTDLYRRLSNKRQDDRGIWLPNILAEGPELHAKDVAGEVFLPTAGVFVDQCHQGPAQIQQDVEMTMA